MRPLRGVLIAALTCLSCSPSPQGTGAHGSTPRGWCVQPSLTVDSTLAVAQAARALGSMSKVRAAVRSALGETTEVLVPHSFTRLQDGFVVGLVPKGNGLGGGGLVWVDAETGCAIPLKAYE